MVQCLWRVRVRLRRAEEAEALLQGAISAGSMSVKMPFYNAIFRQPSGLYLRQWVGERKATAATMTAPTDVGLGVLVELHGLKTEELNGKHRRVSGALPRALTSMTSS